jgi:hypothetical protein
MTEKLPDKHGALHLCVTPLDRSYKYLQVGRAIAKAVSRWLPTAAARVQSRV